MTDTDRIWRVTYRIFTQPGHADFHCELDARAFIAWGDHGSPHRSVFTHATYHRLGADDGYTEAALPDTLGAEARP
jgi:hypothetical protein